MEVKIPFLSLEGQKKKSNSRPKIWKCIECSKEAVDLSKGGLEFSRKSLKSGVWKTNDECPFFFDTGIRFPLCAEHLEKYNSGKKISKASMWLMIAGFLPVVIGLIIWQFNRNLGIPFFILGFILEVFGLFFISPADKLIRQSGKSKIVIKRITENELILEVFDERIKNLLMSNERVHKR